MIGLEYLGSYILDGWLKGFFKRNLNLLAKLVNHFFTSFSCHKRRKSFQKVYLEIRSSTSNFWVCTPGISSSETMRQRIRLPSSPKLKALNGFHLSIIGAMMLPLCGANMRMTHQSLDSPDIVLFSRKIVAKLCRITRGWILFRIRAFFSISNLQVTDLGFS